MPNKEKNIPKRRFKEFENADAWELRKLGEVGTVAMCRRIFKEQTSEHGEIPFYKIGTFGGTPDAFIARELFEEFKDKYSYPNIGDILISASGSIGRTVEFLGEDEYFQDSNIVWLKHDGKINNIFLKQFYSIVKWSGIEGSTIKRLYNENILNTEISLPTLPEQKAIGSFFSTLDQQITLHQRKLDKLKSVKQAYLSEMFPAEGERVPKRRFPGFTDAWELRKLGEYSTLITKGTTPRDKSGIGVVNFVKVENLVNGDIIPLQKIQLEEHEGYLKRSQLIENDILFSIAGTLGRTAIVKKSILPANTNQALSIIRGYEFDRNFLVTILRGVVVREFIKKNPTIGAQPNLSLEQVSNLCFLTPCSEEQSAIGTFFSTLDQQITLHQRKLEKLKNLKKALLNELFV
ncbi:restriction endonuclease subunit S [Streptococcus suis]|uniref:restriction endonuclease subunit S n=1 Tax=Streptococcus suis TaxID=1307 RepID=UPI002FC93923